MSAGLNERQKAYGRMRKQVATILDSCGMLEWHRISKRPDRRCGHNDDEDSIVIHGMPLPTEVDETVVHALDSNGIQYTLKRSNEGMGFKRGTIVFVKIPVDQAACPQPYRG